jgi:hypothetical protein
MPERARRAVRPAAPKSVGFTRLTAGWLTSGGECEARTAAAPPPHRRRTAAAPPPHRRRNAAATPPQRRRSYFAPSATLSLAP